MSNPSIPLNSPQFYQVLDTPMLLALPSTVTKFSITSGGALQFIALDRGLIDVDYYALSAVGVFLTNIDQSVVYSVGTDGFYTITACASVYISTNWLLLYQNTYQILLSNILCNVVSVQY